MATDTKAALKMTRARIALITEHPFFGMLAMRLKLVEDDTINPPTMRTNGRWIKYHPKWVTEHSLADVKFVVAHEVCHCICGHMARGRGREPARWGHAIDYVVNSMLEESKMKTPVGGLYNPAFKGMSADEVYSLLPPMPPGSAPPQFDSVEQEDVEPLDPSTVGDWQTATVQAANIARKHGNLPGSIQRLVEDIVTTKTDWRVRLRQFATAASRDEYSFTRFNRRSIAMGLYLPGLYNETLDTFVVVADDSGSIDDQMLAVFSAEASAARDGGSPQRTIVMSCDAEVNFVVELDRYQPMQLESHGGGGTDFRPPFDWLEERGIVPQALIYLTDGYGPFPDQPAPYPVLWCMTTDVVAPWGETLRVDLEEVAT